MTFTVKWDETDWCVESFHPEKREIPKTKYTYYVSRLTYLTYLESAPETFLSTMLYALYCMHCIVCIVYCRMHCDVIVMCQKSFVQLYK